MITLTLSMSNTKSDIKITDILAFDMNIKKNCHTAVHITGVIAEDIGEAVIFQQLEQSTITISETKNDETSSIFCGLVDVAELYQEGKRYIISIEGVAFTQQLDYKKKCRSFQNTEMTYRELVNQVIADTEHADVLFCAEDGRIGYPIYQYEETDWEFLKRIASQLETSLVSVAENPSPQLFIGLPKGLNRKKVEYKTEKIWFDKTFYQLDQGKKRYRKQQFLCHDICSFEKWKVGERIALSDGQIMAVLSIQCSLERSLLTYRYTLALPEVFATATYENPKLAGVSLSGTVLAVDQESVRVWLNIDKEASAAAFWYDWIPETGNVMYCMPEIGECVSITFDDELGNARAGNCIRKNGTGHVEMQDSTKRYFTTAENKRLYILPECLGFVDLKQSIPLKIELNDIKGTSIESNRDITIMAKEGIWLEGDRISFLAPQEISLIKRDILEPTVLNMCNGFDSIGKYGEVKTAGTNRTGFPILGSSETEEYDIGGAEAAIMGSTPCKAGNTELEKYVIGSQVQQVFSDK